MLSAPIRHLSPFSGLRAAWRNLSLCWRNPDASAEVASIHRVRQFQALSRQLPVSAFDCMACSVIDAAIFWNEASHVLLVSWCLLIWAMSGAGLWVWRYTRAETEFRRCLRAARQMTAVLAISGSLFAVMLAYLFGLTDIRGQLLLTAFFAATIAHGAFHNARWPWAGGLWGMGMCLVGAATLLTLYGDTYTYLALLLVLYGLSVVASVLVTSRLFVRNLMAETEIERQRDVIALLFNDFEDDASDWLWESDPAGNLRHVSPRLADILGIPRTGLLGLSILDVFSAASEAPGKAGPLRQALQLPRPFLDVEVPRSRDGRTRWWQLRGKPLFDVQGAWYGWRGVGSEITAEVLRRQAECELAASRAEAARVAAELDTARRIQLGLLPNLVAGFVGERRFAISAILEPAREVGGDYYECFLLDDRRLCLAIADVSGKGIPASLFMAMTKVLAASMARRSDDLGQVVSDISRELDCNNAEMLFVTAFIAVLDTEGGELTFVSAGHDAPLLLRGGKVSRLEIGHALGPPMCSVPDYDYSAGKIDLQAGDTLCLFTDGLSEATDGQSFFGVSRLAGMLAATPADASVGELATALRDGVRRFEAGHVPADDLAILVFRWLGRPAPLVEMPGA